MDEKILSDDEAADWMRSLSAKYDTEVSHGKADELLCRILKQLGYKKTVDEFEKMDRWYA